MTQELLRDLARAKVAFQLRTLETILTSAHPSCRWCGAGVARNIPCSCDRAQNEARRIKADRR